MSEDTTPAVTRMCGASAALSVAALVFFVLGLLLSWPRVAVLIVPVLLGAVALVLAIRARGSAGRPGRAVAVVLSALAIVAPAVTVLAVVLAGVLAPSSVYTFTVDSPEPVSVIIRDGADQMTAQWDSGDTVILTTNAKTVGINAQSSTPTTVISCAITRDGNTVVTRERAGSVDCSFSASGD